jgi:deoxyadenosine/deoxycytidine kinase
MSRNPSPDISLVSNLPSEPTNQITTSTTQGNPSEKKVHISIEGNIASGKSTVIEALRLNPSFEVFLEPTYQWENIQNADCAGSSYNLIRLFYEDPAHHAFELQEFVRLTFLEIAAKQIPPNKVRITERNALSAEVFVQAGQHLNGLQRTIFEGYINLINTSEQLQGAVPDVVIYLETDAAKCLQRIKQRGRPGERQIEISYLHQLEFEYKQWITKISAATSPRPIKVYFVNGNNRSAKVIRDVMDKVSEHLGWEQQNSIPPLESPSEDEDEIDSRVFTV